MNLFALLEAVNINDKIKHAPNSGYLIGVWIGYILPFAVLAGLAYWMYYRAKNRQDKQ
jgi:hypothetical protein